MNADLVRAAVRGQLTALQGASVSAIQVAQAVENAVVAGIETALGSTAMADPNSLTESEVLAQSADLEQRNAKLRAADIAADPALDVEHDDKPVDPEAEAVIADLVGEGVFPEAPTLDQTPTADSLRPEAPADQANTPE
jgi:hypothetical protein